MSRYGYLDMPDGWSDVSDERAMVPCVECGRRFEADVESTWIKDGRTVAYCGCGELADYRAEMREEDILPMEEVDPEDYMDDFVPAGHPDFDAYQVW